VRRIKDHIRDHPGELLLGGSFLLGILLLVLPGWNKWTCDRGIITEFGIAFLIAPILAIGIEQWMTKRIARDVFRAAFSYQFPPDFKDEITRIASHGVICPKHIMMVKLTKLANENISVTVTIERHFENVSATDQSVRAFIWIDEWGIESYPSEIKRCELFNEDGKVIYDTATTKRTDYDNLSFEVSTPNYTLKTGKKVSSLVEYTVARRQNDFVYEQFGAPTRNPVIFITEKPDDIEATADFGGGPPAPTHIPYRYELAGVYFAPAPMKIRWWPKSATLPTLSQPGC
jgi:hypothetical protein